MASPTARWIGCGGAARKLGSSARLRTLAFTMAFCLIVQASAAVAASTAHRQRGPTQSYTDNAENAAQTAEGSDDGRAHEQRGDADEYETDDVDLTAGGGSGGGRGDGGGADDEQSAEPRRQPGAASFGSNEPGEHLSSDKMAIPVDGDTEDDDGSDDYDEHDSDSVNATVAAADSDLPARHPDWGSTATPTEAAAAEASFTSVVGASGEVSGGDAAAAAAAAAGTSAEDEGSDVRLTAPKMAPPPQPCSDGAPVGVSLEVAKASAVGGKGIRGAADANTTLDNGNLSAVLATTFGSVSVLLLLLINGFVIRRTWMHGCRQKKSQVLLRPRRVACRRRQNRYGTTKTTDRDEIEM